MNVYQIVTEKIIAQLEAGVAPWQKPWATEWPCNLVSGKQYRGLNPFLLAIQGYGSKYWVTYNQVQKLGGSVRAGEKSSLVTFWRIGEKKIVKRPEGERETRSILLRYYSVFNVEQTSLAETLGLGGASREANISEAERIVTAMPNPPRREQSHRAYYRPKNDTVGMPAKTAFSSVEGFYGTLFHELVHSTGHASRIGRDGIEQLNTFGSESYSKEELIAELGAAMLAGVCGISPTVINNNAAYLKSWIEVLRGDSKLIVSAASAAQKAADYIQGNGSQS
jgi:antirestriction protein ArdC